MRASMRTALLACGLSMIPGVLRAQIDPKTALLERAAFDALSRGDAHAAAAAFRGAIAGDPRNAQLHLGAGAAAALERRDADARDAFERALALDPKLTRARALLGQVQYRLGDVTAALRTYETVIVET